VLGLTISLTNVIHVNAVPAGLLLAVALAFVIRPVLVGLVLIPVKLRRGERIFVLWSGLKGAVPVLLGTYAFSAGVVGSERIYDIIFVVVTFSVIVQGGLVPFVARWCGVPMRTVQPEPFALAMRFRHEPRGLDHYRVTSGAPADGCAIGALPGSDEVWISLVNRGGHHLPVSRDTVLQAGDEVLAAVDPDGSADPVALFGARA